MIRPPLFVPLLTLCAVAAPVLAAAVVPVSRPVEARLRWFDEARFGIFIHWSPSSVNGTEIGWGRKAPRPMEAKFNGGSPAGPGVDPVYDNLYKQFNPTAYDADAWVALAKDAGAKYLVFTSKHHEGFSMWPTRARDGFDISDAPYKGGKGDILRDLADACHRGGMRLGWYYSPRDWTHPDYGVGDNAKYSVFMAKQLDELLGNYGKIDLIWWDSFGVGDSYKYWHADKTLEQIRRLQPDIVTNNRCSFYRETNRPGLEGDFDTPEQTIGKYQIHRRWESCITLVGHNWGYNPVGRMMPFEQVIATLVACATGDGNLLLNTGPMPDGRIEPRQAELLRRVGGWMAKYGESIYGTRGGPFPNGRWGGATFKGDDLYLHVLPASPDLIVFPKLGRKLTAHSALTGGAHTVEEKDGVVRVKLDAASRVSPVTLLKLTFDGPLAHVNGVATLSEAPISGLEGLTEIGAGAAWTASSLVPEWSGEKDRLLKEGARGEFAFHTRDEAHPWLVIDLKSARRVNAVLIDNRPGYESRLDHLTLSVSEDGVAWTPVWRAEKGAARMLAIPESVVSGARVKFAAARYLKLETAPGAPTALHLKRVRIYGE